MYGRMSTINQHFSEAYYIDVISTDDLAGIETDNDKI